MAKTKQEKQPIALANIVAYDSLYKTVAATEKAQSESRLRQDTENVELQRIACSHIVHLAKHKDIRVIRKFLDEGMHDATRKDSMVAFFERYSMVVVSEEGKINVDTTKATNLGDALCTAWWKMTKPSVYKGWVFEAELAKFLATAEKHLLKPRQGDDVKPEHVAVIAKLRADLAAQATAAKLATSQEQMEIDAKAENTVTEAA